MEKVGLFHFVAEPYLMDFRGRVTLPMIGNYLIHAASSHAGERGFGFNDMSERHTAWVLSRLAIEDASSPVVVSSWRMRMGKPLDSPVLFGRLSTWRPAVLPYWI